MTPEMQSIYDRLKAKVDAQWAIIKANPRPYIEDVNKRNALLQSQLDQLRVAAYPDAPATLMAAENAGRPDLKPLYKVTVTREDYDCLVRIRHLLSTDYTKEQSE